MDKVLAELLGYSTPKLPDWLLPVQVDLPDWLLPAKAELPDWILPAKAIEKLPDWIMPVEQKESTNIIQQYIDYGWKLIPLCRASKKPLVKAWTERSSSLQSSSGTGEYGVAIQHAYSNTCSLDIDDLELARPMLLEHGIDVDSLLNDSNNVQVVSGVPNKAKLLFKLNTPLQSQIIQKMVNGVNKTIYELRSAVAGDKTQVDTLPPSIHPVTQQEYRWKGDWKTLPMVSQKILLHWQNLIAAKATRKHISVFRSHPTNEQEILTALTFISPDCNRKQWIDVGMGIHNADLPFDVWRDWSSNSNKFDEGECAYQWESFEQDGGITLGTLFAYAKDGGYTRPKPDVSELFRDTRLTVEYDEMSQMVKHAAPDIDVSVFPDVLRMRAEEISLERGCDVIVPLFAGLSAMSTAMDAQSRLYVGENYAVPPVLWTMTIGSPGDKKTPGSTPMFDVVRAIEKEQLKFHAKDLLDHESKEARYQDEKKKFIAFATSEAGLLGEVPPEVSDEPIKPTPLRMLVSDVTSQKMCHILCNQPRGMTANYDELGSWVRKVNDPRSSDDRGAWIQAYEAGTYAMDRVGSGYMISNNFAATIYGNLQPKVLASEIPKMANDGLLQRFIPGIIRADKTTITQRVPKSNFKDDYESQIRNVFAMGKKNYYLDDDAAKAFRDYQIWFERARQDNRVLNVDDVYMTAFSKLESTVARIALIFHAYTSPLNDFVSGDTMAQAIKFVRFYVVPALKFCYQSTFDTLDQWIVDYVTSVVGIADTVSMSEIRRSGSRTFEGLSQQDTQQKIIDVMYILESMEWVVNVMDTRHSKIWAINPTLVESCKANRKKILLARQRVMDETTESVAYWANKPHEQLRKIVRGYTTEWDNEL